MNAILLAALVALPAEWKNTQPFTVAQPGLIKLSLPAATLDAARPGLEDLRILDDAGREVPYTIERPMAGKVASQRARSFRTRLDAEQGTQLLIETGVTEPLDGVTLETPALTFIKAVTVSGSQDGREWQELVAGQPIFRQGGATQLRISFPPGRWPWLSVTVNDRRVEAIPFTGAWLHPVSAEPAPAEPVTATIVERAESDGQTRLVLDLGAAHLTLATLRLETSDPLFTRPVNFAVRQVADNTVVERVLFRDTIYRVAIEGFPSAERVEIPLDLAAPYRELLVWIDNADNQPLNITAVRATRRPVYAVFLAPQSGNYRLLTGNPRCSAPRYDVAALAGKFRGAAVTPITMPAVTANPAYQPAEPLPEIQDLGTALDLAPWSYRKRVPVVRAGVQQLELDLETLAHADASMRDVRLVRDGMQRPYILERPSLTRQLAPSVTEVKDPKRPSVSRWVLKLSQRRLPVTRVTCTTRTPLFRRTIRVFEQPTDERGEKYDRPLGEATWVRTPPASPAALVLPLTGPVTDTLILETDNGDNAPLELDNFQCWYPVTRLLFKAPVEPATFLYYGNAEIGAPQYDLDLIAPRLLAEEKSAATLGAEEVLRKSGVGELFALSGTKSLLFWGALAVAVVVLLVVIAKLLPKPPAT
jgi:hypothetical protein